MALDDAPAADLLEERISRFRADLNQFDVSTLVQRHITTGPSYLLDEPY